ncbi:rhomboid family intramembrane serine protease [Candidatus Amarolinea aalborgensis]|jgi:rhomboid protease GluP|uniref:rhomboid family intramembrane serine protease n=1 Tax=Candidatus Amarolinea aalborgensis TaxID=2249329 RepID=UPI003BF9D01B
MTQDFFETATPAPSDAEPGAGVMEISLPTHKPLWSYVLIGVIVAVWLLLELIGWVVFDVRNATQNGQFMLLFGAKYNALITAGEWWRLLTAAFLHFGLFHLLMNSFSLSQLGPQVERFFGRNRFLIIYLLAGLYGNLLSYLFSPSLSAGASGAIFGLLGAFIAYLRRYRKLFGAAGQQMLRSMLMVVGFNLVYGFTSGVVDNYAHIGGLVAGFILGELLRPEYAPPRPVSGPQVLADVRDAAHTRLVAGLGLLGVVLGAGLGTLLGR